jgi:hypothetical protein
MKVIDDPSMRNSVIFLSYKAI